MKFILGQKKEMTQKFKEDGTVIPVTKVVAEPCIVTQIKSGENDGYVALQIGCGNRRKLTKAIKGHLKGLGNFRFLREFRLEKDEAEKVKVGDQVTVETFSAGDSVDVTGISKGKGFQGVVRRHGFSGSPASHGHKDQLRMPGSIGCTGPAHVFKGTRMGGRMGGGQVTVTNLKIVEVDPEKNEIFIMGAVPGPRNNLLLIKGEGELVLGKKAGQDELTAAQDKEIKPAEKNEAIEKVDEVKKVDEVNEDKKTEVKNSEDKK